MERDNKESLENKNIDNPHENECGKRSFGSGTRDLANLFLFGTALTGVYGAMHTGAYLAAGRNIGWLSPILTSIIPFGMGYAGYKMPHLSGFLDNFSEGDYKFLEKLISAGESFCYGLLIDAAAFGMGCGIGYLAQR